MFQSGIPLLNSSNICTAKQQWLPMLVASVLIISPSSAVKQGPRFHCGSFHFWCIFCVQLKHVSFLQFRGKQKKLFTLVCTNTQPQEYTVLDCFDFLSTLLWSRRQMSNTNGNVETNQALTLTLANLHQFLWEHVFRFVLRIFRERGEERFLLH